MLYIYYIMYIQYGLYIYYIIGMFPKKRRHRNPNSARTWLKPLPGPFSSAHEASQLLVTPGYNFFKTFESSVMIDN